MTSRQETVMTIIGASIMIAIVCCSCRTRKMVTTSGSDAMEQAHRVAAYHAVDSILRLFSLSADSLIILLPGAEGEPATATSLSLNQDIDAADDGQSAKAQGQHRPSSSPVGKKGGKAIKLYGLHLAGSEQTVEQRLSSLRHDTSHQSSSHQSKEVVKSPPLSTGAIALSLLIIAAIAAIIVHRIRQK